MTLPVDLEQLRGIDVRIALRRAQARVAEQLLNRPQVGAALQEMRRERVAQGVGADAQARAACGDMAPHQAVDAPHAQPPAAVVHEQRLISDAASAFRLRMKLRRTAVALAEAVRRTIPARAAVRLPAPNFTEGKPDTADEEFSILQIRAHRRRRAAVERDDALLAALAEHAHHLRAEIEIL